MTARRPCAASPAGPRAARRACLAAVRAVPRPRPRASGSSSSRRRRRRAACGRCGGRPTRSPARAAARPCGTASRRRRPSRSASEPPPRATTTTSTSSHGGESCSARVIAGAAWRSWTGAKAQTTRPAQPRRRSAGEHVVARLAALAGDDADAARQGRPRQPLLGLEEASAASVRAQDLDLGEQITLAGQPQAACGERERGRGASASRVVVRAAGDDHLAAVMRPRRPAGAARSKASRHIAHGTRAPRRRAARTRR